MMNYFKLLIFFLFIGCNKPQNQFLHGVWTIGQESDTLSQSWQPSTNISSYTVHSDSGIYKHIYGNNQYVKSELVEEINAEIFKFETDSSGVIEEYRYNLFNHNLSNSAEYYDLNKFIVLSRATNKMKIRITPSHLLSPYELDLSFAKDTIYFRGLSGIVKNHEWYRYRLNEL